MKHFKLLIFLLLSLLLTGCSSESIADRVYTQAIGLTCDKQLSFYTQGFEQDSDTEAVTGTSIAEVLRCEESVNGGKVFIGHTELLCLDGTCTLEPAEELLFQQGLSPACKILYTNPKKYFQDADSTATVHMIRMSEQNGLLSSTELSTALNEWHGIWETALIPAESKSQDYPELVLLHKNGTCTKLSDTASKGMYWLRRNSGSFTMTLETPDGEQDIFIEKTKLQKSSQQDKLYYHVIVNTKDSNEELRDMLQKLITKQCKFAVLEMLRANADVIGMQDLLENANIEINKNLKPEVEISVSIE
ncbi:MAG: hypothetical protein K2G88_00550 [Oscillospiraceae bacterium]|nr:hypothetical protein [Oscillospiraceae bacterium]